jgi:hypothetical protein
MGMKFIGERSAELLVWPESERRRVYLQAVRRSYCSVWTWVGFAAFLTLGGCSHSLAERVYALLDGKLGGTVSTTVGAIQTLIAMCGWIVLGLVQVAVIRKELRKMNRPQQPPA